MSDISVENYYYDAQIRRYIVQFMAIFSGLQVAIGKNDYVNQTNLIPVPIIYGDMDKVVASIKSENTQNKPVRVPIMSVNVASINLAPDLRHGVATKRRSVYLPLGEVLPDGLVVEEEYMPVPYRLNLQLSLFASNTNQRFQMLEPILSLFDPMVQIQTSDAAKDWTKLTTVTLENLTFDNTYPIGTERRLLVTTLDFSMPIYMSLPVNYRNNFIKQIQVKIDAISATESASQFVEEEAYNLDGYEAIIDIDELDIPKN